MDTDMCNNPLNNTLSEAIGSLGCRCIRYNWETLPDDAPLLPFPININSEKLAGKIGGKVWVN